MNEYVQCMTGQELHESDISVRAAVNAVLQMEKIKNDFVDDTGLNFAIARTPAESTAQHFAVKDLLKFNGEAYQYVKGDKSNWRKAYDKDGRTGVPVYYTNGFMVNHSAQIPIERKIDIEQKSFPLLSGGNIFNVFLGEKRPDVDALYKLTKHIALETQIGYFSYTVDLTMCLDCFFTQGGLRSKCSNCNSINVKGFSRVTGYVQSVDGFNAGKEQELLDRYHYIV